MLRQVNRMRHALVLHVHLHDARYHGVPDWPPSPARLFQALVAGASVPGGMVDDDHAALEWLEQLPAPTIAAPIAKLGRGFRNYVPNNDLDSKGGDPARVFEIRVPKLIRPWLLDHHVPIRYFWEYEKGGATDQFAAKICSIAERLYQLGRGVDMAWAWGDLSDEGQAHTWIHEHRGPVHYPGISSLGTALACPAVGSLRSLLKRHEAQCNRFSATPEEARVRQVFTQAPKAHFRQVGYDNPPTMKLYDLIGPLTPWPLAKAPELVTRVRDAAVKRLNEACDRFNGGSPQRKRLIERVLVGRETVDRNGTDRIRIIPIPSIGSSHADRAIRRVLVQISPTCPIRSDDIDWGISGNIVDSPDTSGEALMSALPASDPQMLRHYGASNGRGGCLWRTVTPAVLPEDPASRGVGSRRNTDQRKVGSVRAAELTRASGSVLQALRHARISTPIGSIRVQREPFEAKGTRAEAFCAGTRFSRERLWHVEINFVEPVFGPVVIGDGRYAGLGVMAPVRRAPDSERGLFCFSIEDGLSDSASALDCTSALRRAVMSRAQHVLGPRIRLPLFFSGHESNGAPAKGKTHSHLAYATDLSGSRLLVIAPHALERRSPTEYERARLAELETALQDFSDLRAGPSGRLTLKAATIDATTDPLLTPSMLWESVTEYVPTRHAKRLPPREALTENVRNELLRIGMPTPVDVTAIGGTRFGLRAGVRLRFATAVPGLILVGRNRHFGGGLFSSIHLA